jgi:hypothetical protein
MTIGSGIRVTLKSINVRGFVKSAAEIGSGFIKIGSRNQKLLRGRGIQTEGKMIPQDIYIFQNEES